MIVSDCTGWSPNEASYAIADDMVGDWRIVGNPCRGDGAETSFGAQSTFILPVHGRRDAFIFMADRWNPDDLGDSRYVWLPIRWDGEKMIIEWLDRWDLTFFERRH
jgi:beta-galactosidase